MVDGRVSSCWTLVFVVEFVILVLSIKVCIEEFVESVKWVRDQFPFFDRGFVCFDEGDEIGGFRCFKVGVWFYLPGDESIDRLFGDRYGLMENR